MPRKAAEPKRSYPKSHTVKPGETLRDVAAALGVSEEQVTKANGLRHNLLAHGTRLVAEAPTPAAE